MTSKLNYSRKNYCYSNPSESTITKKTLNSGSPIKIQALDWSNKNERVEIEYDSEDSSDDSGKKKPEKTTLYYIYCFGITEYGETVTIRLDDYTPYFFVKLPNNISESLFKSIIEEYIEPNFNNNNTMNKNSFEFYKKDLIDISVCTKKDFWGFQEEKLSRFVRITFRNTYASKAFEKAFNKPIKIPQYSSPTGKEMKIKFNLYESNVDPMLRFFHWRKIEPCGWLEIKDYEYNSDNVFSNSMYEISANWKNIGPKSEDKIGRIFEASFDIECESSDGSFPLAIKDWNKIVNPILEYYIKDQPIDINQYIKEKIDKKHLILKNPQTKKQLSEQELIVADDYFQKIHDLIVEKLNSPDSKQKKIVDEQIEKTRHDLISFLNGNLGVLEGDKVIQIGTTVYIYELGKELEFMFTLKNALMPENPNCILKCFNTEQEVLLEFTKLLNELDPDVLTGYNIFGFDMKFLYNRAKELGIQEQFLKLSRYNDFTCPFKIQDLSSSALGKNILEYIEIPGRVVFDTMKYIRRNHALDSYKLDSVVNNFMRGDVKKTEVIDRNGKGKTWIYSKISEGIKEGNYITLQKNNYVYEDKYKGGEKIPILAVEKANGRFMIEDVLEITPGWKYAWAEGKDDIEPHQIFEYQRGNDTQRGIIAKYCLQDCRLCNRLLFSLDTIVNSVAMANVNCVPLSFIFNRGQGIKLFSFVAKEAKDRGYCIPVVKFDEDNDESYEGAFVLDPKTGIYFEDAPIAVADFNSLYPSCMISENLCHTTICLDEKYKGEKGAELLKSLGYDYADIEWDLYEDEETEKERKEKEKVQKRLDKAAGKKIIPDDDKKRVVGKEVVRYVQPKEGKKGVLPSILEVLLKCRKDVRKKQANEDKGNAKWKVYEGQQLAYKVTANSLYGVTGASTSPLCLKSIAAATTATGRKNIMFAKDYVEKTYPGTTVVYGDTDSIFIKFNLNGLKGLDAIYKSIDLCTEAAGAISKQLKRPHNLEFEKVICPMILCAKKKYVGFYYTDKSPDYTIKYMGIVLKRRDNAPIVKHVFGEAIEILLKENDVPKAIKFIQDACNKILVGGYGMDKFIMSKTLKDSYANPEGIAHKVLADRMGERDPGNKPLVNDRIPFVYVEQEVAIKCLKEKKKNILQGDKIEHPEYIVKNKLPIDYLHYITNQIMNPVCQVFDLVINNSEDTIFKDIIKKEENRRQMLALRKRGFQDISKFFVKK